MIAAPETSFVVLDNQAIEVTIEIPSGRFRILDKIASLEWIMKPASGCGSLYLSIEQQERSFELGRPGDAGIPFETNYYMVRSSDEDDFHDVMLNARLPGLNTSVTLRFLLSFSEPLLDCFFYLDDESAPLLSRLDYPVAFVPDTGSSTNVMLPENVVAFAKPDGDASLWQPPRNQRHAVGGSPFFVVSTEDEAEKQSSVLGFLMNPYDTLLIDGDPKQPGVTPCCTPGEKSRITEEQPFHFRYQVVPVTDVSALIWLSRETLLSPQKPIVL